MERYFILVTKHGFNIMFVADNGNITIKNLFPADNAPVTVHASAFDAARCMDEEMKVPTSLAPSGKQGYEILALVTHEPSSIISIGWICKDIIFGWR